LTGLPNRLEATIRLKQEFARYKRNRKPFSACAIDIDFFKSINDKFGHAKGDDVLKVIAKCLTTSIRETDFVARIGGEELLLLLPDTPIELAPVLAEKLRKSIAAMSIETVGQVTVSIGVSAAIESDLFETDVIDRADKLLYKAKDMGRNQVQS
jgi:diguanylate cyclase